MRVVDEWLSGSHHWLIDLLVPEEIGESPHIFWTLIKTIRDHVSEQHGRPLHLSTPAMLPSIESSGEGSISIVRDRMQSAGRTIVVVQ
jgi:hypothetical protein